MTQPRPSLVVRSVAVLSACILALAACGGSDDTTGSTGAPGEQPSASAVNTPPADPGTTPTPGTAEGGGAQGLQQNGPITVTGDPLPEFGDTSDDPAIGMPASTVEGEGFDGSPITIGGPTENPTMVVFLAHWCPHCNDEVPVLVGLNDDGRFPRGLDVIGVSTGVDPTRPNYPPSDWIENENWPWPVMADDAEVDALLAFGGTSFPYTVLLDVDGNVLARRSGEASAEETVAFLDDALSKA